MEDPQFEIVSLYGSRSKKRCMEDALVLQAMGIQCDVLPRDVEFALVVHVRDGDRAREQLRLYLASILASGFMTEWRARASMA